MLDLSKKGLVDGVYTEDMDILTFGAKKIIRNLTTYKRNTIECKTKNLNTPRDCFVHSNYKCKWCELSNRCNMIE